MKIELYNIIFTVFFLALIALFTVHIYRLESQTIGDNRIERNLSESTKAALNETNLEDMIVFEDESVREDAVNAFYNQLNKGLGYSGSRNDLGYYHAPFVVLVDTNGYYISYLQNDTDSGGNEIYMPVVSNLHTYTKDYASYLVRYSFSNFVSLTTPDGITYTGLYSKVFEDLGSPNAINFMSSALAFKEERTTVICDLIEADVNYYINTRNEYMNQDAREYTFTMPKTDKDFEARLIDNAGVIAFCQGKQSKGTSGYTNVYAFAGSVKDKARLYYVEKDSSGNLYYHERGCSKLSKHTEGITMEDAAKKGAIPDVDCVR